MILSDNGTNFIGVEKELRENIENLNTIKPPRNMTTEALGGGSAHPVCHIKVASGRVSHLVLFFTYAILGTHSLIDGVQNTTSCLVQYALNDRSLAPVSADSSDLGATTPNHFLGGNR